MRRALRRTGTSLVAFIGLLTAVFFLSRLTGNPAALYLPLNASPELREEYAERHGFNDPVLVQFFDFVKGVSRLDFGESLAQHRPALEVVTDAYAWTFKLAVVAMLLATIIALVLGGVAVLTSRPWVRRLVLGGSLVAFSMPDFWLALMLIALVSVGLDLLPVSGTGGIEYWILPVIVLAARPLGIMTQVVASSLESELFEPYVRAARIKGLRENVVVFVHAMRNSLTPVLQVAGDQAAGILNGAVIVESIFGWPGVGRIMFTAVIQRDFAVLMAAIAVTGAVIFLLNVVIDLLYVAANPRVRIGTAS